jgi:hypothetical protein
VITTYITYSRLYLKAGALERLAAQNAKPTFNLIKPGSVGGRKVQMHVGMALEPAVVLGLVSTEIVEDDVNLPFFAVGLDDAVHEIQELPASPTFVMTGLNQPGGNFESRDECRCPMPFVFMSKARNGSPVGQTDVALSPLQSLNARLFIDA